MLFPTKTQYKWHDTLKTNCWQIKIVGEMKKPAGQTPHAVFASIQKGGILHHYHAFLTKRMQEFQFLSHIGWRYLINAHFADVEEGADTVCDNGKKKNMGTLVCLKYHSQPKLNQMKLK